MESVKKYLLMFVISVVCCRSIEAKGLCEFAEMSPSEKYFTQRKSANNDTQKDSSVQICPQNMKYGISSCQATCEDPHNDNGCSSTTMEETCVCPTGFLMKGEDCVREEDCGCFVQGGRVIKEGDVYTVSNCSKRCSCITNQLMCEDLQCNADANCSEIEDVYQCVCKEGFVGDGQTCDIAAIDCLDLYTNDVKTNGVYTIYPTGWTESGFEVYCEMTSGGWTVFQQRVDGTVDFYRNWTSYKHGFGLLTHEFWLGNDKIHILTQQGRYQLRIDALNSRGAPVYITYNRFSISDENDRYRLRVGTSGSGNTVGNPLMYNKGQPFSTYDHDNEDTDIYNCASQHHGAWWYSYRNDTYNEVYFFCWKWKNGNSMMHCGDVNLNGGYHVNGVSSIYFWYSNNSTGNPACGFTRTQMKMIRSD